MQIVELLVHAFQLINFSTIYSLCQ